MKNICQKHSKKDDHSNIDISSSHCLHVKRMLCQSTIDLQDDHQIRCNVCVDHLTRVVQTLKQRRRHDDEARQDATSMFANDQWQLQNNVDANSWDRNLCETHSITFSSSSNQVSTTYERQTTWRVNLKFLQQNKKSTRSDAWQTSTTRRRNVDEMKAEMINKPSRKNEKKRTKWTKCRLIKRDTNSFKSNDSSRETFIKLKIVVESAKRWRKIFQAKNWRYREHCRSLRMLSFHTCEQNA
jgi:hypothetical protein